MWLQIRQLLALSLFCPCLLANLSSGIRAEATTGVPLPSLDADVPNDELLSHAIHFMRVGFSDKNSPYQIGWRIPQQGWEQAIRGTHAPVLKATGGEWLWLHNPFGAFDGEVMQLSTRVRLQNLAKQGDRGAKRVLDTFLPTMRKLLEGDYTAGRRVGVVLYFGNAATDRLLKPLYKQGDLDAWRDLWQRSLAPVRLLAQEYPGQVMLGSDSIEELPADHPHYVYLDHLHNHGLPVIGEPRFLASRPHLFQFGMLKVWRQDGGGFDRTDPDRFPTKLPMATNAQIKGPRFALYRDSRQSAIDKGSMSLEHLRSALRAGAIPVLDLRTLLPLARVRE